MSRHPSLAVILNSEKARRGIEGIQAKGQCGARHFEKAMFELPIPKFDPAEPLHLEPWRACGARAETLAVTVDLPERVAFVAARRRIRDALRADRIAGRIDELVSRLLDE